MWCWPIPRMNTLPPICQFEAERKLTLIKNYGKQYAGSLKKTKNRATIWSSYPTPEHIPRENHNSKRIYIPVFIAVLKRTSDGFTVHYSFHITTTRVAVIYFPLQRRKWSQRKFTRDHKAIKHQNQDLNLNPSLLTLTPLFIHLCSSDINKLTRQT